MSFWKKNANYQRRILWRVTVVLEWESWGTISSIKHCRQLSICLMLWIQKFSFTIPQKEINKNRRNKKSFKVIDFYLKCQILKSFWTNFQKQHLIWRYRFYGCCRGANTFPARKYTPEPDFLFSQTSKLSFHKF